MLESELFMSLLFGSAGIPHSTRGKATPKAIEKLANFGLDCMEIAFVRNIYMSEQLAEETATIAEKYNIVLSCHAPYYINLNSSDEDVCTKSVDRLLKTLLVGSLFNSIGTVFHPAYYMEQPSEEVFKTVQEHLYKLIEKSDKKLTEYCLLPETTGRIKQFGTLSEILQLCKNKKHTAPCIDIAHIYARSKGEINSSNDFQNIMEEIITTLGRSALDNLHIHISGISYGQGGELKHQAFDESEFNYKDFLRVIKDYDVSGRVICESPDLEKDALIVKEFYHTL